jgi:hypothetical protein
MKNLILSIFLVTGFISTFSQEIPRKQNVIKEGVFQELSPASAGLDCKCDKNLLQDGSFSTVIASPSTILQTSPVWKPGGNTSPQYSRTMGACDTGFVSMWGNKKVGEFIYQSGLAITAGKCYTIKFNARFPNNTGASNPYVQLAIAGSTGINPPSPFTGSTPSIVSSQITGSSWATYTISFTAASSYTTLSFYPVNGNSQNDGNYVSWINLDNICIQECCSCDIPKSPAIVGATDKLCACDLIKFSTVNCPGATYKWTITDDKGNNISYTGSGNAITLTYSLAQQLASSATGFTVTVEITCGRQTVKNSVKATLKPVPKTNISFSLNDDGYGNYTATANSLATANGNGWTLKEVNCPGPNPCSWVAGSIKWQSTGNTINIPQGVLVKGKCYVLTHYANVCSPVWIAGPCTVYQATCFKLDGNNVMKTLKPTDKNDALEILPQMIKELQAIK